MMPFIRAAVIAAMAAGSAGAAFAQDAAMVEDGAGEAVSVAPAAPVAPWYQRFTQDTARFDLGGSTPSRGEGPSLEFDVGGDIGLSLGFERSAAIDTGQENLDGLNAGAFFKVSPRLRVGGELGYRAENGNPASLRPEDQPGASQIRLESAFRF